MGITLNASPLGETFDGVALPEACRQLEEAGADVVGFNCVRGPDTMLPIIKEVKKACKGPVACLPATFRTDEKYKGFQQLKDYRTGELASPVEVDPLMVSRGHIRDFTKELRDLGIQYMGLCCGGRPYLLREMAEALGRRPPASEFSPDMSKHASQLGDASDFEWS